MQVFHFGWNHRALAERPMLLVERFMAGFFFVQLIAVSQCATAATLKLYWSDGDIHCANLDGTLAEDIIQSPLGEFPNVAFDTADQKMYWPSAAAGGIERANYDGTDIETAISGIAMPRKVAIDTVNRKAYWVDYGFPNDIRRSNLDGTDRELLFSTTTLSRTPVSVAVDPLDGYYYWTGLGGDLHRTSLDGSDTSIINLAAPLGELAIDAEHRYLYVSAQDGIIRMRLDLSDPMVWRAQNNFSPAGIAVDSTNGRLMLAGYQFSFYGIDISSITLDGTDEGTAFFARNSASDAASAWSYLAIVDIATPEPNSMTLVWPAGIIFLWRRRRGRLH